MCFEIKLKRPKSCQNSHRKDGNFLRDVLVSSQGGLSTKADDCFAIYIPSLSYLEIFNDVHFPLELCNSFPVELRPIPDLFVLSGPATRISEIKIKA